MEGEPIIANIANGIEMTALRAAKKTLIVGRNPGEKGLQLDDSEISRRQAEFAVDHSGRILLRDMSSTNGTFVNGEQIKPKEVCILNDGDDVNFADKMTVRVYIGRQNHHVYFRTDDTLLDSGLKTDRTPVKSESTKVNREYKAQPRTTDSLGRLMIHRMLNSGLSNEEILHWAKVNGCSNPEQLLSQAKRIDVIKADLKTIEFSPPKIMRDKSTVEIGKTKFIRNGREYIPIIVDGRLKLVYLSLSRKVYVELKAVTRAEDANFWHVKQHLEATHDTSRALDWELKRTSPSIPSERILNERSERQFFQSFGVHRKDQEGAMTEVVKFNKLVQDQGRLYQLTDLPELKGNPETIVVDRRQRVVEFDYLEMVATDKGQVDACMRVVISKKDRDSTQISVTPWNPDKYLCGMPEEKFHRGPGMKLNERASKVADQVSLSTARKTHSRTDEFEAQFRSRSIFQAAEKYILGKSDIYPSIAKTNTVLLT